MTSEFKVIAGLSSAGKSEKAYRALLTEAHLHPDQQFIVLIPEQAGSQIERRMIQLNQEMFGHPGFFNVDIIGFGRYAYRIFERYHVTSGKPLEEYQKKMMVRLAAGRAEKELTVYKSSIRRMGFLQKCASMIAEFVQYGFSPEDVEKLSEALTQRGESGLLPAKLSDVAKIYEKYLDQMTRDADGYLPEERLKKLVEVLNKNSKGCPIVDGATILFDEFRGFTPDQLEVIRALDSRVKKMTFTLTADATRWDGKSFSKDYLNPKKNIYATSVLTLFRLQTALGREPDLVWVNHKKEDPELDAIQKNALQFPLIPFAGERTGAVRVCKVANPYTEIRSVVSEIRSKVMASQGAIRYRDFAVVSPSLSENLTSIEQTFADFDLPVFLDVTRPFTQNPYTKALIKCVQVVDRDFDYDHIFGLLRTGIPIGKSKEEIDALENFVIRSGIRGARLWSNEIRPYLRNGEPDPVEEARARGLEETRKSFMNMLNPLLEAGKKNKVATYLQALRQVCDGAFYFKWIQAGEEEMKERGLLGLSSAYHQLQDRIVKILQDTEKLLGDVEVSLSEFSDLLETGLASLVIAVVPSTLDAVTVASLNRSKLPSHIKYLYVLNINEGVLPASSSGGHILSDKDKKKLADLMAESDAFQGKYLAPGDQEHFLQENFFFLQAISKPSAGLTLCTEISDSNGNGLEASFLISRIENLLPLLGEEEFLESKEGATLDSERESFAENARNAQTMLEEGLMDTPDFRKVASDLAEYEACADGASSTAVQQAIYPYESPAPISGDTMRELAPKISVSGVQAYASCPYNYYFKYILRIQKRRQKDMDSADAGSLSHEVMKKVIDHVKDNLKNDWENLSEEDLNDLTNLYFEESWTKYCKEQHLDVSLDQMGDVEHVNDGLVQEVHDCLKALALRSISIAAYQIRGGRMLPKFQEYSFQDKMRTEWPDGEEYLISMKGSIDRVDTYETEDKIYVRVLDYKTGNHPFSPEEVLAGTDIQLPVYMKFFMEQLHAATGKEIIPLGLGFYHLEDPQISFADMEESPEGEEALHYIEQEEIKAKKLMGPVNGDSEHEDAPYEYLTFQEASIIDADGKIQTGLIIPIQKYTRDKDYGKSSWMADTDTLQKLCQKSTETLEKIAREMLTGNIKKYPVTVSSGKEACKFCDFKSICRFDERHEKRNVISKMSNLTPEEKVMVAAGILDEEGHIIHTEEGGEE